MTSTPERDIPPLFRKLNLKDHAEILVMNAPREFDVELAKLHSVAVIRDSAKVKSIGFAIAFAVTQAELDRVSKAVSGKATGDAILWIAYPKGTSKRYRCEFNRDSGWDVLHGAGFDTVRQVAIDDDWSALRFRRLEHIKPTTRDISRRK